MKNQRGITLIALVITIIVLLILAGVSIAMLTGENGILNKATSSRSATNEAEVVERINLALNAVKAEIFDQQVDEQNWEPINDNDTSDNKADDTLQEAIKESLELDDFGSDPVADATAETYDGDYVYTFNTTTGTLTLSYYNTVTEVGIKTDGAKDPIEGTIDLSKSPYTVTEAEANS